jgi:hypothetical protein
MASVVVRFLGRAADAAFVLHPRAARRLIRPYRETNHICCVRNGGGFTIDVLEGASRPPADTAEIWLLPKDDGRPARVTQASAA